MQEMIRQTMPSMQGDTDKNESRWTCLDNPKKQGTSPRMIKMDLNEGPAGTVVTLWIDDLILGKYIPKLAFNALIVNTKVVQSQGGVTTLIATVPSHHETRCSTETVPIYLCLLEDDNVAATWHLTNFSYEGTMQLETPDQVKSTSAATPILSSPPTPPQTTPTTASSATTVSHPMNSPPYHDEDFYHSIALEPSMSSLPGNQYSDLSMENALSSGNDRYQPIFRQQRASSMADLSYNDDDPDFSAHSSSGFTNFFTENFNPTTSLQYTPRVNVIQQSKPAFLVPTTTTTNRIETPSTYHHRRHSRSHSFGPIKATGHQSSASVASYQPYPGLISRANLVLLGDLNSMTENWHPEEWQCYRRLVRFHRETSDHDIRYSFQKIPLNGMPQSDARSNHPSATATTTTTTLLNETAADTTQQQQSSITAPATTTATSIVVSCIYWPEKEDWFITSVDCIHLLEHLLGLRFSVEEKNRVRRNLEGFRPLTVSKSKSDSADFFKLIMSFPNPKPRNIEKDLKVFQWKTLPYALKKIITKYTSSSYGATVLTNDSDGSKNTLQRKHTKQRLSYQDLSPTLSPMTLSSGTATAATSVIAPQLPQLPTLSSSSSSSSASLPSSTASSASSAALYHRRASAPTRDFNSNSDYRPYFSVSSPTSMTYQPQSFNSRPLSTSDPMASYRYDPTTARLPPLDDTYALPDLINPVIDPSPTSPVIKSDVHHL